MNGYAVIEQSVDVAGRRWRLKALKDRQQFHDPSGAYEAAGVSSANWPLFGIVWPAGVMLAEYMATCSIVGEKILEVGCGLALSSLVVHSRGGDVTASDIHPLAGHFLADNASRNHLAPVPFKIIDWAQGDGTTTYSLIIGSDLLYERGQPELLASFVGTHCDACGTVVLTDPGRGQMGRFNRLMRLNSFSVDERFDGKSRLVRYMRSTLSHQGARSTT